MFVSIPSTALAVALGPTAIELAYGTAYADAGRLFIIMAPTLPLLSLVSMSRGLIAGVGRQRSLVAVAVFAAISNLALAVVLIRLYDSTGAAISNASAQALAAVAYVVIARRLIGSIQVAPGAIARNVFAAAAAGATAWATCAALGGVPGVLFGLVAFTVVYGGLAVLLHVLPGDDGRWLESVVGERLRGRRESVVRRLIAAASGA